MKSRSSNPPPSVRKLREAAVQEVQSVAVSKPEKDDVKFDKTHGSAAHSSMERGPEEFDAENWVAKYPGQNSPHVGNGSGGVRR